jgi:3-dehydroquinate dehydratase-2
MKLLVIHGPNINLLGTREPETYGALTMQEINTKLENLAKQHKVELEFFQSNIEGEIVTRIQESENFAGIIINPAAYTHTSVAIRDALAAIKIPAIEVHISNIYKREEFRHSSLTAPVCLGQISGFGAKSYELALMSFIDL